MLHLRLSVDEVCQQTVFQSSSLLIFSAPARDKEHPEGAHFYIPEFNEHQQLSRRWFADEQELDCFDYLLSGGIKRWTSQYIFYGMEWQ